MEECRIFVISSRENFMISGPQRAFYSRAKAERALIDIENALQRKDVVYITEITLHA